MFRLPASRASSWLSRAFHTAKPLRNQREIDVADVCIVGGGPAGLATAIRLKQLDSDQNLRVIVLEKAADMGSHTVSGAVLEPRALKELFPDSSAKIPLPKDIVTEVTTDQMRYLTDEYSIPLPEPPQMKNKGKNFIVSLGQVVQHLASEAEALGVEVYPSVSCAELVYSDDNSRLVGVATKDMGVAKDGLRKDTFEPGIEFRSKVTVLAEGCHGLLSKQAISRFNLRQNRAPQTYGLGIKEVWQCNPATFQKGLVAHTVGYPYFSLAYGGGWMYHFGDGLVSIGTVIGLDYQNPYINPYQEFQLMKQHPFYRKHLENGKCLSYAARTLNEGGLQSVPKLHFPGGVLVGASAGFMNVPKIKGTHTAMKSGMLAAEQIYSKIKGMTPAEELEDFDGYEPPAIDLVEYQRAYESLWIYEELLEVRNVRPSFNSALGLYGGLLYLGLETLFFKGRLGYTLSHGHLSDAAATLPALDCQRIEYPKPDNKVTFDLLTSVSRTGTYHQEDEECHLRISKDMRSEGPNTKEMLDQHTKEAFAKYDGIELRFCPAGVYEYIQQEGGEPKFQINSQNCIHCKTCDIKVPTQDINWGVPEGGDGPKYYMT